MSVKRRICCSIGEVEQAAVIATANDIAAVADVIEIRLDYMVEPDCKEMVRRIDKPLLFTNRPVWEGGLFEGSEEKRIDILLQAVEAGAAYIDLELKAPESNRQVLKKRIQECGARLIVSSHDFEQTADYSILVETINAMKDTGADMGKLITTAESEKDALTVLKTLEFAQQLDFPLITFCMGKAGAVTRVSTCDLGGYMTYCAAVPGTGTAPGQLDVTTMQEIFSRY